MVNVSTALYSTLYILLVFMENHSYTRWQTYIPCLNWSPADPVHHNCISDNHAVNMIEIRSFHFSMMAWHVCWAGLCQYCREQSNWHIKKQPFALASVAQPARIFKHFSPYSSFFLEVLTLHKSCEGRKYCPAACTHSSINSFGKMKGFLCCISPLCLEGS